MEILLKLKKSFIAVCLFILTTTAMAQQAIPYTANWETDLHEWTVIDNKYESKTWNWKAAGVATITDSKRENDDWLISPAINCSGTKNIKVAFKAGWNKAQSSNISLYYSTDFSGDQAAANWTLVEEKIIPDSHPYGFKTAGFIPCNFKIKVNAQKVHFAIRYSKHNVPEDVQNEIRVSNFKITGKK